MNDIEEQENAPTRAAAVSDKPTFAELGVRDETVAALAAAGIERAFAIQEYALPIALRGSDMIGQAPTGTGKTFAFGLPLIDRVFAPAEGGDGLPQALVVVPTRELGLQVAKDLALAGKGRGVRVLPIYGGVAYEQQTDPLKAGVEILVGTPGRLMDLAKQKKLRLDRIRALVLDEADRMLDLGFLDDVEKILAMLPEDRQTMLFSATMPDPIVTLARRFLRHPVTVHAGHTVETGPSPQTLQVAYRTHPMNKIEMVARILQARGRGLTMIFTRTKRAADRLSEDLDFRGFAVAAVHGDLGQGARERALRAFRAGKIDVLVATDVAARGLDVSGVTHVINYDCPEDPDTYTHRIGRTGRAGATGVAVTFVDWEDMPRWHLIDKSIGLDMREPPETYHTSPYLYTDLDIPTDVAAALPSADRTRAGLSAEVEEDLGSTRPRRSGRRGSDRAAAPAQRTPRTRKRTRRVEPGDGAGTEAPAATMTETAEDEASAKPRRRRRRAGEAVSGEGATVAAEVTTAEVPEARDSDGEHADASGDGPKRRRRRRGGRGGRGAGVEGAESAEGTDGGSED
ncbi:MULTISPECIES: DEAD/DEAH box helicase [Catenuloplanes]|uniref:RNA helicase n=1 Tax=Catenuloplanes niger TaxID=587534 RepID=A0AAE4CU38_9ACTN|nr:DEAD/DEAH box helicase [Catenuloplanes niger]MDR7322978.1 superfamily II DNA/RNA helicase [Catenuloplanes niger]